MKACACASVASIVVLLAFSGCGSSQSDPTSAAIVSDIEKFADDPPTVELASVDGPHRVDSVLVEGQGRHSAKPPALLYFAAWREASPAGGKVRRTGFFYFQDGALVSRLFPSDTLWDFAKLDFDHHTPDGKLIPVDNPWVRTLEGVSGKSTNK